MWKAELEQTLEGTCVTLTGEARMDAALDVHRKLTIPLQDVPLKWNLRQAGPADPWFLQLLVASLKRCQRENIAVQHTLSPLFMESIDQLGLNRYFPETRK